MEPRYTVEFVGLDDEDALARIPPAVRANLERAMREAIDQVTRELEQELIYGRQPKSTGETRSSFGIVRTDIA
jgi:hypothetical protein